MSGPSGSASAARSRQSQVLSLDKWVYFCCSSEVQSFWPYAPKTMMWSRLFNHEGGPPRVAHPEQAFEEGFAKGWHNIRRSQHGCQN